MGGGVGEGTVDVGTLKRMATAYQQGGRTGMVVPVETVLALVDQVEADRLMQAQALARKAGLALLDHDLELVRRRLRQIGELGERPPMIGRTELGIR